MKHILFLLVLLLLTACAQKAEVPGNAREVKEKVDIYPDYTDVTVPPNIAPLDFMVRNDGNGFVCQFIPEKGPELVTGAGEDGKMYIDSTAWHRMLNENRGCDIKFKIYCRRGESWVVLPQKRIYVAEENIDSYVTYRLIEPLYQQYCQMGIYQRNLTNFDERVIYETNCDVNGDDVHCVNCHNFQAYNADKMLMHVRAAHSGTVFVNKNEAYKLDMRPDSMLANCVYPSWHPRRPWVVFTSTRTWQVFHTLPKERIEVFDTWSNLVFYDVEKREVSTIVKNMNRMQSFPCWNPEGTKIYYCEAEFPAEAELNDTVRGDIMAKHVKDVHYSLMSMDFDSLTHRFSNPQVVIDADSLNSSILIPRVNPDGRYIVFTMGKYGMFHIHHSHSDLYSLDLKTGAIHSLGRANSDDADSYCAWSSNGRWITFATRREDGNFTRLYITYFDKRGHARKAFCLPQRNPEHNLLRFKSYNVPEMTRNSVQTTPEYLKRIIFNDDVPRVRYVSE